VRFGERQLHENRTRLRFASELRTGIEQSARDPAALIAWIDEQVAEEPLALRVPRRKQRIQLHETGGALAVERSEHNRLLTLQAVAQKRARTVRVGGAGEELPVRVKNGRQRFAVGKGRTPNGRLHRHLSLLRRGERRSLELVRPRSRREKAAASEDKRQ
jgi:hypothetical protein